MDNERNEYLLEMERFDSVKHVVSSELRKISAEKRFEIIASELANALNIMGNHGEGFVKTVTKEHRTIQQLIFKLFMDCVREWAKFYNKDYYDLRNEDTCKIAHEITRGVLDQPHIRYI